MTLTFEYDLDMVKLNQQTTYLGQRSCSSKVLSAHTHTHTHTHKHTHTQPSALSRPRKWSIIIAVENGEMENVNYQMIQKRKHRIAVQLSLFCWRIFTPHTLILDIFRSHVHLWPTTAPPGETASSTGVTFEAIGLDVHETQFFLSPGHHTQPFQTIKTVKYAIAIGNSSEFSSFSCFYSLSLHKLCYSRVYRLPEQRGPETIHFFKHHIDAIVQGKME